MSDPDETAARLRALEERIARAKAPREERHHSEEHYSQAQIAWRMVTELVAGLGIGFGIGYGLDLLLGTTPFLMIVMIFLGLAAGIKTMMRTAAEVRRDSQAAEERGREGDDRGG